MNYSVVFYTTWKNSYYFLTPTVLVKSFFKKSKINLKFFRRAKIILLAHLVNFLINYSSTQ